MSRGWKVLPDPLRGGTGRRRGQFWQSDLCQVAPGRCCKYGQGRGPGQGSKANGRGPIRPPIRTGLITNTTYNGTMSIPDAISELPVRMERWYGSKISNPQALRWIVDEIGSWQTRCYARQSGNTITDKTAPHLSEESGIQGSKYRKYRKVR